MCMGTGSREKISKNSEMWANVPLLRTCARLYPKPARLLPLFAYLSRALKSLLKPLPDPWMYLQSFNAFVSSNHS
jgi:hypothetical protein